MTKKNLSPLAVLAARIAAHLKRFESDPAINIWHNGPSSTRPYYLANAWQAGRYVGVSYINYQGGSHLTKDEAERYLAKLDAGFVGRHYEAPLGDDGR